MENVSSPLHQLHVIQRGVGTLAVHDRVDEPVAEFLPRSE